MKRVAGNIYFQLFVMCCALLVTMPLHADNGGEVPDISIRITISKGTRYQLLRHVSEQSGYFFVYDSKIINNDEKVKIRKGKYSLLEAIYVITGNRNLKISLLGNHILLNLPIGEKAISHTPKKAADERILVLRGRVYDGVVKEVIPYVSVGITHTTLGTVTNQSGEFKLLIPDSLLHSSLKFSYVGYDNQELAVSDLAGRYAELVLQPKVISLQEVVVRAVNPLQVLEKMQDARRKNYSSVPVYLTSFYREVIEHKRKNIDLTEAVLKVYKTDYSKSSGVDQVKLVKMRRVFRKQEKDTIFTKMKSGIKSCLMLDVMKNIPDFLNLEENKEAFVYRYTDISEVDKRRVYVISFEQRKYVDEPLYKGELYVDAENYALLEAHFEINPLYAKRATDLFVAKRSREYKLILKRAAYTISYKLSSDDIYYINHVRGELEFRVRRRRHFFSTPLNLWFEMVTCQVDAKEAKPFPRAERLSTRNVFSETEHDYDADFWEHFNIILPEEELRSLIRNNLGEVTTTFDLDGGGAAE